MTREGMGAQAPGARRSPPAAAARDVLRRRGRAAVAGLLRPTGAAAVLAGAVAVQTLGALPPRWVDILVAALAVALALAAPVMRWLAFALAAAAWTMLRADLALSARLPHELEGVDIVVTGSVTGLPRSGDDATRFGFVVDRAERNGKAIDFRGSVRLGWYDTPPPIPPCSNWRLRVRLKRPRALIDPGAFDFERHALAQGINATGYVRDDAANRQTGQRRLCVDRLRARIGAGIAGALGPGPRSDVLRALTFGDQQAMDEREWQVARATGIPHLIAISGLHIAMFAAFGVWLVRVLWKLAPRVTLRWPAPLIEAVASLVFAGVYATLAGLGLPTRRALVMIGVLLTAGVLRRSRAPQQGLAFAVVALLAIDPLCVLAPGFWLSFVGVAWLMLCLGTRGERRRWWRELVGAQGVASLGLLPLTIWFFGQSSLVGPLANLVAVPWVCFVVLPAGVAGGLLQLAAPAAALVLLRIAAAALGALWRLLELMAAWPGAMFYFPEPRPWALALALLGAFWLLLPRGLPARGLGALLLLPLLVPAGRPLQEGEFEAFMLDVGQGLSFVVRTRGHALVYDAGARFPSGFDLGEASVVPALHAAGVRAVDRLIVSHGDNDHAGGAGAVLAAFPAARVESGQPERLPMPARQCLAGEQWRWDGVSFRIVHPHVPLAAGANDRCCVLEVRAGASTLLLTGDISAGVEPEVAAAVAPSAALVLQVPHHGSRTSSSASFLAALQPSLALVSAGYRNRFHHPSPVIVARYAAAGAELLDSATTGFVAMRFTPGRAPRVIERGRIDRHPYWREE